MILSLQIVYKVYVFSMVMAFSSTGEKKGDNPSFPTMPGYTLIWNEEFDYSGLPDSSKWNYQTGDHGWGNNEKQLYVASDPNVTLVKDGYLTITAHAQESNDKVLYKSARITTKGKGDWLYGMVEVKAKIPSGVGTWPAIWMLPTEDKYGIWPKSGEIDIMEHVGYHLNEILGTVHIGAFNHIARTQKGGKIVVPDAVDAFHVYKIDWTKNHINFFVDD